MYDSVDDPQTVDSYVMLNIERWQWTGALAGRPDFWLACKADSIREPRSLTISADAWRMERLENRCQHRECQW